MTQGFQPLSREQVAVQTGFSPQDIDAIATYLNIKKAAYAEADLKRFQDFKTWMTQNKAGTVSKAIEILKSGKTPDKKPGSTPPSDGAQTKGRKVSAAVEKLAKTVAPNIDNEARELRILTEAHLLDRYEEYMTVPGEELDDPRLNERYARLEATTSTVVTVEAEEVSGSSPLEALGGVQLPALPSSRRVRYLNGTTNQPSQHQTALPAGT